MSIVLVFGAGASYGDSLRSLSQQETSDAGPPLTEGFFLASFTTGLATAALRLSSVFGRHSNTSGGPSLSPTTYRWAREGGRASMLKHLHQCGTGSGIP